MTCVPVVEMGLGGERFNSTFSLWFIVGDSLWAYVLVIHKWERAMEVSKAQQQEGPSDALTHPTFFFFDQSLQLCA